jgi:hypothetical protein
MCHTLQSCYGTSQQEQAEAQNRAPQKVGTLRGVGSQ